MTFSVRHEGSPRAVSGLTAAEIIAGLEVGRWEPTDEVRGDGEADRCLCDLRTLDDLLQPGGLLFPIGFVSRRAGEDRVRIGLILAGIEPHQGDR